MILVLTNDDGVDAPGIEALHVAVEGLGEIQVIAPSGPQSGCGHTVTAHRPIQVRHQPDGAIGVEGTPADCVRLAVHHLAPGVDWVISGINAGGNLGVDMFHSGTVAAVREAAIHGKPGIAVSHFIAKGRPIDWDQAARWTRRVVGHLLALPWQPGTFWNVNLPHPEAVGTEPEIVHCPADPSPLPLNFQVEEDTSLYCGDYQARARRTGSDIDVCFGGRISVTLVRMLPADLVSEGLAVEQDRVP
ncbi:MAG: 5'/3'-nucleotidase SurE [Isosphaeraceae bacterium]